MRARGHLAPNDEDNFGILASDSLMGLWQNLTGTLASGMVGIGLDLPGHRRRGHHERHAVLGHGTYARNRDTQVAGR